MSRSSLNEHFMRRRLSRRAAAAIAGGGLVATLTGVKFAAAQGVVWAHRFDSGAVGGSSAALSVAIPFANNRILSQSELDRLYGLLSAPGAIVINGVTLSVTVNAAENDDSTLFLSLTFNDPSQLDGIELGATYDDVILRIGENATEDSALDGPVLSAVDPTQPTVTEPTVSQPTLQPTVTEPTISEPTLEPTVTEPTVSEPTLEPTVTEPTVSEPTLEPTVTEPTISEPTLQPTETIPTFPTGVTGPTGPTGPTLPTFTFPTFTIPTFTLPTVTIPANSQEAGNGVGSSGTGGSDSEATDARD